MILLSNRKVFILGQLFGGLGSLAYGAMNAAIEDPSYRIIHQWQTMMITPHAKLMLRIMRYQS